MSWNRLMWGIELTSGKDAPMVLGSLWEAEARVIGYTDEPTRALLFRSRKYARAWCKRQHEKYQDRSDCCALWKFRPIRVRETVKKVK